MRQCLELIRLSKKSLKSLLTCADFERRHQHEADGSGELGHQGEDGHPHPQREISLNGELQHVPLRWKGTARMRASIQAESERHAQQRGTLINVE